ncbi:MAG: 16S rRNA (guanine(527)-N(7))-methyltransferase RsmG [Desulfobulbaceae bacterium]|nr:16S rRNA (guanine(527)-N(7))-methyltransferase RsmG [Desulfobulbaceae bacterium]
MTASEIFHRGLNRLGLDLSGQAIDLLCDYLAELQKWNKRINLVADAPLETLIETHFLDSLTLLPLVKSCPPPGLMDIGSGAGFPGLVLKIACPDLQVTLIEPRQKRTAFMRQVIRALGLKGVSVLETRLEKDNEQLNTWQNATPILTSRAFASINLFLDLAETFCAPGGKVICMKGRKATAEVAEWQQLSATSPFKLTETIETALPFTDIPRKLLVFTKG